MSELELVDISEEGKEEEKGQEDQEETSFSESTKDNYDNTRTRISSEPTVQSDVDLNDFDAADVVRQMNKGKQDKEEHRDGARQILEIITREKKFGDYGEKSRELLDNLSEAKFSEKGKLTALKFKGKDVKLTKKGEVSKSATLQNREIFKAIEDAKVEYENSADAVVDEGAGTSVSNEARRSVEENVADSMEDLMWDMYGVISKKDLDGDIEREIRGIPYVDENIDYDNLEDPNQKILYDSKIASLKKDIKHWENLGKNEQDPTKKLLYDTAKELCVARKSLMEVKAGKRPESKDAQTMIRNEAARNDLTRFERFKKWAKENITGVSAVPISIAGIITTVVIAGRSAVKKGAKAVGQFGKALAKIAKKAAPAIATILNILAQALTWGAKALEFLSRNLWIVALFLTYLLYDSLKDRYKRR